MKARFLLSVYLVGAGAIALNPMLSKAQEARDLSTAFQLPDATIAPTPEPKAEEPEPEPKSPPIDPNQPLPIPPTAAEAPVEHPSSQEAVLPPPPPLPELAAVDAPPPPPAESTAAVDLASIPTPPSSEADAIALSFGADLPVGGEAGAIAAVEPTPVAPIAPVVPETVATPATAPVLAANPSTESLFMGGAESVVARVVGSAEGTRTAEGLRTPAYYGHTDPGNGVWNLGSFSYQHGAASPEEADERQLKRLQQQTQSLLERAAAFGLELTLEEKLNGIDLANQAPKAALDRGGYIDWLAESRQLGMTGQEAIAWARTRSFLDPDTQQWNAPGLGNTVHGISHDQERRMQAIARALTAIQTEQGTPTEAVALAPTAPTAPTAPISPPTTTTPSETDREEAGLDRLFNLDLF